MATKNQFELEALEPRILLSADGLGAGLPSEPESFDSQILVESGGQHELSSDPFSSEMGSDQDALFADLPAGLDAGWEGGEVEEAGEWAGNEALDLNPEGSDFAIDAPVEAPEGLASESDEEPDSDGVLASFGALVDVDDSVIFEGETDGDLAEVEADVPSGSDEAVLPEGGESNGRSAVAEASSQSLESGSAVPSSDPLTIFENTGRSGQQDHLSQELVTTLHAANGPPSTDSQQVTDVLLASSAEEPSGTGIFVPSGQTVKTGDLDLETLTSYLGYRAQGSADGGLTVFASDRIELSALRPHYLATQGVRSLTVQGSDATDDTLVIDLMQGNLPLEISYHGGAGGYDVLEVAGVDGGSYTPGAVFGDGVVMANGTRIEFTGLEPVTVTGADAVDGTFTFTTPSTGGGNDVLTIDSPSAGTNRISGTSGGTAFENITFSGIAHFVIDTAANDQAGSNQDTITFTSDLEATDLVGLTIRTGDGGDTVDLTGVGASGLEKILVVNDSLEGQINRVLRSLLDQGWVPPSHTFTGSGDFTVGTTHRLVMSDVTLTFSNLSYSTTAGVGEWSGEVEVEATSARVLVGNTRSVSIGVGGTLDSNDPDVTAERLAMQTLAARQVFALGGETFELPETTRIVLGSVTDATEIGWVDWLHLETTALSMTWNPASAAGPHTTLNFSANVLSFKLPDLGDGGAAEAAVNALAKLQGTLGGVVVDLDLLSQGKFAVTDMASVSIGVTLSIPTFGGGEAGLVLGIAKIDDQGDLIAEDDTVTTVADRFLYGAILGKILNGKDAKLKELQLKGDKGGAIRIGLSELGPLALYIEIFEPVVVHAPSGLTLTDFRGGISFNNPLPSITDPEDLRGSAFEPTNKQDIVEWTATLKQQVANQIKAAQATGNYSWGNFSDLADPNQALRIEGGATMFLQKVPAPVLNADVDFIFSTDGKFLMVAKVNVLTTIHFSAWFYLDFSDISGGTGAMLFLADLPEAVGGISPLITMKGSALLFPVDSAGQPLPEDDTSEGAGLLLQLSGRLEVQIPGIDPVSFQGDVDLAFLGDSLTLTVYPGATAEISVLGAVQSIPMGSAQFTIGEFGSGFPAIWGYAVLQANDLGSFLPQGIKVSGTALFKINSSGTDRTVEVLLAGAPSISLALSRTSIGFFLDGSLRYEVVGQTLLEMQGIFLMEVSGSGLNVLATNVAMTVGPPGNSFLTLRGSAFLAMSASGVAARMYMNLETNFPAALGIQLSATFNIAFNSTSADVSITVPTSISGHGSDLTVTVPRGPPAVGTTVGSGTWTPSQSQPYLLIQADGTLTVLNTLVLTGKFDFLASTTTLSVAVDASLAFGPFNFRAQGGLLIDSSRFAGLVSLTVQGGLPSNLGITFQGGMTFELGINTGAATTIAGVPLSAGEIRVKASGSISVLSLTLQGTYTFTLGTSQLTVAMNATTTVFGTSLGVNGFAGLYYGSNPGLAFRIQLTVGGGPNVVLVPVTGFSITANFELVINTTGQARDGIAANTYQIGATNVSVNLFGFTLAGDLVISISSAGFSIPNFHLELDFFGAFTLNVSGAFHANGDFSFTASSTITFLDPDVFGFRGTVAVTFSNSGFSGSVDAEFGAFGIKVGGSGSFAIENGLVKLAVRISLQITPEIRFTIPMPWPFDDIHVHIPALIISGTWRNTFGALSDAPVIPPPPELAKVISGNALRLNLGGDVAHRGADYPATDESYNLTLVGPGTQSGQKIKVSALGYDQIYDNVASIVANNTGSGTVFISIAPEITVPVSINDGVTVDGSNHFILGGGPATIQGGSNYDWIDAGAGGGTFYGGTGDSKVVDDHGNLTVRVSGYDSHTISDSSLLYSSGGGAPKNMSLGGTAGVGNVILTGANDASFTVTAGWTKPSLSLYGAGANSSVTATTVNSYHLTNSALTNGSGQTVNLTGISVANLSGIGGAETFTVSGWSGSGSINGFGGSDKVIASNDANFSLSNSELARSGRGSFALTSVEQAELSGGAGANSMTVGNWTGSATLNGAGSGDTYQVNTVGSGGGTVTINDTGGTAGDTLTVNGTTAGNHFTVNSTQVGLGSETVHYSGLEHLTVDSLGGSDSITVNSTAIPATFKGGDDDDIFTIRAIGAAAEVQTGSGGNTVHVGSTSNTVEAIGGRLTVTGSGADTLNVNDFGDGTSNAGLLTGSRLTGLGMGGNAVDKGIAYSGVSALHVSLGTGADRLGIQSTSANTTINTGSGEDTVNVGSAATANANGGGTLNGLLGALTVNAQGGIADALNLDDTADSAGNTGSLTGSFLSGLGTAGITYTGLEVLDLGLGSDGDTFTVKSTHAGRTEVEAGGGNDQIGVWTVAGLTEIDGQDGTDTFTVREEHAAGFSTVNGIGALLKLRGGNQLVGAGDRLVVSEVNEAAAATVPGSLSDSFIAGLGMSPTGGIDYQGFEILEVTLGQGGDAFAIASTHPGLTTLWTGKGNDVINIASIGGETRVRGEAGNDVIRVNVNADGTERLVGGVTANGVGALLDLDGQTGSDSYRVYLAGNPSSASYPESLIRVHDTGGNGQGTDFLEIFGTDDALVTDNFLVRRNFIALVPATSGGAPSTAERIDYDDTVNAGIAIYARAGDDYFAFDDTSASMTVDGGDGNDTFQIGQMFQSERVSHLIVLPDSTTAPGGTVAPGDEVRTIHTTRGYLTPGVQAPTTVYGGDGEDQFIIFSNQGPLGLFGEDGDDRFVVRAFALFGSTAIDPNREDTNINAGQGADNVEYNVNAPVAIDGGDGRDTIVVVGTEFSDKIVVTASGIYGAGLFITFIGIEEIEVHAAEGNDHISVQSTPVGVVTRLFGDLGSDTFDVGGQAGAVVSRDLQGHSGIIENLVISDDLTYHAIPVEGVSVDVADDDEPGVVITESGGSTTVGELDFGIGLRVNSYTVVLTRAPVDDKDVFVTVSAPVSSLKDQNAGSSSVQVSTQAPNAPAAYKTPGRAIELRFTADNWDQPQTVDVHAVDDAAPEGTRTAFIQHSISKTSSQGYGGLAMPNVAVEIIDDDSASVVLLPLGGNVLGADVIGRMNPILEGNTSLSSRSFALLLTSGGGTVTVDAGAQLAVVGGETFTFAAGDPAQLVTVRALDDGTVEGPHQGLIRATVTGSTAEPLELEVPVADTNSPGVIILPTEGSTRVIEGGGLGRPWTDSFSVVLTKSPTPGFPVTVQVTALPTPTTNAQLLGLAGGIAPQVTVSESLLTFTSDDWDIPQVIQVTAIDDAVIDGGDIQAFARTLNSLAGVRGPVLIEGGIDPAFDSRLPEPRLYLRETNLQQHINLPNPNFTVLEPDQIDVLRLYNTDAVAALSGRLTSSRVNGLGMGSDLTVFSSASTDWMTVGGGVTYSNLETLELYLGRGVDTFEIESTHAGETLVDAGPGGDAISVRSVSGYTRVLGGEGNDRITLGSSDTPASTLDRMQALITVDGGAGLDTVSLHDRGDLNDNVGTVDIAAITGLDMRETRVRTLEVSAAAAGTFEIGIDGATAAGLSIKMTSAELRSVLKGFALPGVNDVIVDRSAETFTMVFMVDEALPSSALELTAGGAVVSVGHSIPNRIQHIELPAYGGSFEVSLGQGPGAPSFFLAAGDDAITVRSKIIQALNPTNILSTEPGGYGRKDVVVRQHGTTYEVLFQGLLSGERGAPFTFAVDPRTVSTADTFSVNAIGGTFRLNLEGSTIQTSPLAWDASAAEVEHVLRGILGSSVLTVDKVGPLYTIYDSPVNLAGVDDRNLVAPIAVGEHLAGVHYYGVDTLDLNLGSGSDVINIRGTTAVTNVAAGEGDDRIYISSLASETLVSALTTEMLPGNLDRILGSLHLDAGDGRHALMISDEAAIAGDGTDADPVLITDQSLGEIRITGLTPAPVLTYGASAAGNYADGIRLWTGWGRDTIVIDGAHARNDGILRTATMLNTGLGNDHVTVELDAQDGFFVLNTQGPERNYVDLVEDRDVVDGSGSTRPLVIFGGQDDDTISGGTAADIIFADRGRVTYFEGTTAVAEFGHGGAGDRTDGVERPLGFVTTIDPGVGGNDTVRGLAGRDLIFGGFANDILDASAADDVADDILVGDNGQARFSDGIIAQVETTATALGGNDILTAGRGANIAFGGVGEDTILAGGDAHPDILVGDNGRAIFDSTNGRLLEILTTAAADAGADTLTTGDGSSVVLGGSFSDLITSGAGDDVIVGDNGRALFDPVTFRLIEIVTTVPDQVTGPGRLVDGILYDDVIRAGEGRNIVLGGSFGDLITAGSEDDIVVGDNGVATFDATGILRQIETQAPTYGGNDHVTTGRGADIVLAGSGNDYVDSGSEALGDSSRDVVVGDNGRAVFDALGRLTFVTTTVVDVAGDDSLFIGGGDNVALGGAGNDLVTAGAGSDIIVGDNGWATFDLVTLTVIKVQTMDGVFGGNDTIEAGGGENIVLGGSGDDRITTLDGSDIVLGDNGAVDFQADGDISDIDLIASTEVSLGGVDTITTGGGGDIVFGGQAGDVIDAGDGDNLVLGDNGLVTAAVQNTPRFGFLGITVGRVETVAFDEGGNDVIAAGQGNDLILGGYGADQVQAGDGDNIVLGDDGIIDYAGDDDASDIDRIESLSTLAFGGEDLITVGDGNDIIIGGRWGDVLTAGDGDNLVFGDSALIVAAAADAPRFNTAPLVLITLGRAQTMTPEDGGNDTITSGSGEDLIFGGFAEDDIGSGAGRDWVLGDNGFADYLVNDGDPGTLDVLQSTDPLLGGHDSIEAGSGDDVVFGGTAQDTIFGEGDYDILLGDHGLYDSTFPTNQVFRSIFTGADEGAGDDIIDGGTEDDFILGQQGDDLLVGGAGQDDITGGHNVIGGIDGDDTIYGGDQPGTSVSGIESEDFETLGDGADVILGDNGLILRTVLGTNLWATYPAPFPDVIREVILFDNIDFIQGDDVIYGDAGDDVVHGQRGDDLVNGGAGEDEVHGDLGNDIVRGGEGNDILIGDVGRIVRAYNADGSPRSNADGTWHRDVMFEDIGFISGVIDLDVTPLRALDPELVAKILGADLLLLGGTFLPGGDKLIRSDTDAWATRIYLIDMVDANDDHLIGGGGDDLLVGQRGHDLLQGGEGNDSLFGDTFTNTVPFETNLPQAIQGIRLIGQVPGADVPVVLPEGGLLVVPHLTLQPEEFTAFLPGLTFVPDTVPAFDEAASRDGLVGSDGSIFQVFASVVPSMVGHEGMLPGNDVIEGEGGDDLIVGDHVTVFSPLFTGMKAIDEATEAVEAEVFGLLRGLHFLELDAQQLAWERGEPTGERDLILGGDILSGGDGDDTVVGDNALFVAPFMVGFPVPESDFQQAALDYQRFLFDLRHVVVDLAYVVEEAHLQVIHGLVEDLSFTNPEGSKVDKKNAVDPDIHNLSIGNDTIDGGGGDDILIGDDATFIAPVINGQRYKDAKDLQDVDPGVIKATEKALKAAEKDEEKSFEDHIDDNHADSNKRWPDKKVMDLVPWDWEYTLSAGNDTIDGASGEDLLVGDYAVIVIPVVLDIPENSKAAKDLEKDLKYLLKDLEHAFKEQHYKGHYHRHGHDAYSHRFGHDVIQRGKKDAAHVVAVGNDHLSGGPDDDLLLADNLTLVFGFSAANPDAPVIFKKSKFDAKEVTRDMNHFLHGHGYQGKLSVLSGDTVEGGLGDDVLLGQQGEDDLRGGDGDDILFGGSKKDTLDGGAGDHDRLVKGGGNQPKKDILQLIQESFFANQASQIDQFLFDVAATGGHLEASGDAFVVTVDGIQGTVFGLSSATVLDVSIGGFEEAVRGQSAVFLGGVDGEPVTSAYQAQWKVLDASGEIVAVGSGATLDFTPADAGTYTVYFGAADAADGVGVTSLSLVVSDYMIVTDASSGERRLVVGGTGGRDVIDLKRGKTNGFVALTIDFRDRSIPKLEVELDLAGVTRFLIYGGAGDDEIRVDKALNQVSEQHGGAGNDKLSGGSGDDFLFGEEGDDELKGNAGNDVLVGANGDDDLEGGDGSDILLGGIGRDDLDGGDGDDLMLGAVATWESDLPTLNVLAPAWLGGGKLSDRISALRPHYFVGGTHLFDDLAEDKFKGGSGDDWFLADTDGQKAGKKKGGSSAGQDSLADYKGRDALQVIP